VTKESEATEYMNQEHDKAEYCRLKDLLVGKEQAESIHKEAQHKADVDRSEILYAERKTQNLKIIMVEKAEAQLYL